MISLDRVFICSFYKISNKISFVNILLSFTKNVRVLLDLNKKLRRFYAH